MRRCRSWKLGLELFAECDDLAVEHEAREGQLVEREHDFGVLGGDLGAAAAEDPRLRAVANREGAHAVVFQLEEPSVAVERTLGQLGEHQGK